ncbi:MAG: type II TA system antitoxin MqsA family protein [Pirellulales bacterium]
MNEIQIPNSLINCPSCGKLGVSTRIETMKFPYGSGTSSTELEAVVQVHTCDDCELNYLDGSAEVAKHNAVCDHLGVLRATEIRKLRLRLGMSRSELSNLTKLGEATIGRWERGELIQNAANDQFLYLLGYPENVERLQRRVAAGPPETSPAYLPVRPRSEKSKFLALSETGGVDGAQHRAAVFRLHVEAA